MARIICHFKMKCLNEVYYTFSYILKYFKFIRLMVSDAPDRSLFHWGGKREPRLRKLKVSGINVKSVGRNVFLWVFCSNQA